MAVGEDRALEAGPAFGPFVTEPAVVGASFSVVDLLPGLLTDIVDEDTPRAGLDVEGEGFPQPLAQIALFLPLLLVQNGLSSEIV